MRARLRRGNGEHNGGREPSASVPNPDKLWVASVCSTIGNLNNDRVAGK